MTYSVYEEKKKITISKPVLLTLLAGAIALGILIGTGMALFSPLQAFRGDASSENTEGSFKFIRASQETMQSGENRLRRELKPFRYKVAALIEDKLKSDNVVDVSVYFRDLINGNRFGIGERDSFSRKNLLKLPLMIAFFKWAEINPLILRRTLTYSGSTLQPEQKRDALIQTLEPGRHYTVNDLIFRMIASDDDNAYALLFANMPSNRLEKIFKDLDVEYDPQKQDESLSLSAYAAFYRVLFNASYLSEEMSEKALRYLTKSNFRDGMASGIPSNIEIAGKFGEQRIAVVDKGALKQLHQVHEFGIIYYPNRPFLLGVVVRGTEPDRLVKVIRDITNLVYDEVDRQS